MVSTPPPQYTESVPGSSSNGTNGFPNDAKVPLGGDGPKRINVLILGETANGKSTLVKQLGIYGGNPDPKVKIGFGNESCTKTVGSHPMSTNLRSYRLDDPSSGRPIKNVSYSDLVDYTDDDAVLVAGDPEEDGKVYHFDLFDTPGLDDSEGNDMEIMADIIGRIGDLPHLNAVIYVRSMEIPFGNSFNRFYDYLERCMPMLFGGLIIVHSRFTTERVAEAKEKGIDLAEDRREAFRRATKGRNNGAHFFMDNEPDPYSPFAMMQSLNSCHQLLRLLSRQLPLKISNIKLLKAPNMTTLDTKVLLALTRLQASLKRTIDKTMADASRSKTQLLRGKRELHRLTSKLAEYQAELAQLDQPSEIVLGTKTVAEAYTLETFFVDGKLWLDKRDVSFDSDCVISHVQKSAGRGCRWLDEDRRGTTWRATLKSSIVRSMDGEATFYTTSQLKHKGEIRLLNGQIKDLKDAIAFHTHSLAETEQEGAEGLGAGVEKLGLDAERVARTIEVVQRDSFDAGLWPVLRKYYLGRDVPTVTDVVEFVRVYDPETAVLMSQQA
ncbi:hypothetical protein B0H66DRAFT_42635 [Apodospora peruviana]|uniref:G domain-containing protein n=1 Tax=Apodospora peruviana TaxID=516989 RepID=A0AAE0MEV3_9PEZI|nr:hypothetical protein B0H66DRAFT_42635 [Apodospora peruviana]